MTQSRRDGCHSSHADFGFGQKFSRAYGTLLHDSHFPSAEALGYWHVSLRDRARMFSWR